MGLGVCLSGEQRVRERRAPCGWGWRVSGESVARPWTALTGPLREPEGSREPGRAKQGGDPVSV